MDKIEKIRAEIKERLNWKGKIQTSYYMGCRDELKELLSFIDTLEEEPDKSLEEAADKYEYEKGHLYHPSIKETFIAGAKWQKAKMMEDAVEGFIFQPEDSCPKMLVANYNGELKHGDTVRIIIVKED